MADAQSESKDDGERRLRLLGLPRHWLAYTITGQVEFLGIPQDAEIVNISHEMTYNGIVVMLRHESFAPVPCGERVPFLNDIEIRFKSDEPTGAIKFREFLG